MNAKWATNEQLQNLLCDLVSVPSITGSAAEVAMAQRVAEQLRTLAYFQEHPNHVQLHPTDDGRYVVTALVKNGDAKKTVVLVSHFDVVNVEDYGTWKGHAFDPKTLTELFQTQRDHVPSHVQQDMETGRWLFGRGTMDMKCGLTLQMSMIEQAALGRFDGNLLLLAVCDEEVNSVGMRAAVPVVLELAKEYDLEYTVVLNSEPIFSQYPGDETRYISLGTIGKVLPGFLCYGKETHVGEPFGGLNANFMVSHVNLEMELNPLFCEAVEGEVAPPPTNLIQKDLRKGYSVQIPHRAVTLFNLFVFEKPMDEITSCLRHVAETAASRIEQGYAKRMAEFAKLESSAKGEVNVRALSFDELTAYARKTHGDEAVERLQASVLAGRGEKDDREATIELVDEMAILCKELAPMIVLFFAPPYYPPVNTRKHPLIQRVVPEVMAYAEETHGVRFEKQQFFPGICDLSYVGLQNPVAALQPLVANMPLWEKGYALPLQALEAFDVPVLNLGPVGKDAHKWTERLDVAFAFETLPDLLKKAIDELLK